jgi:hypothetical protein
MEDGARIREALTRYPHLLGIYDAVMAELTARTDLGVVASGSLGAGTVDLWSDLDLEVVVHDAAQLPATRRWAQSRIGELGPVLATFPADHVGLDDLQVVFYATGDTVAKLDLWVMPLEGLGALDGPIVHDPGGVLAARRAAVRAGNDAALLDVEDLHHKLTGWCWYTITKVARGELLEAADSLAVMRARALLPCLLWLEGAPREGYRRAEQRLPMGRLASLQACRPRSLAPAVLKQAVLDTGMAFAAIAPELDALAGRRVCTARLEEMLRRVALVPV